MHQFVDFTAVRFALAIAVAHSHSLLKMDIRTAFLHGEIDDGTLSGFAERIKY